MVVRRLPVIPLLVAMGAGLSLNFVLDRHQTQAPDASIPSSSAPTTHEAQAARTQAQLDELRQRILVLRDELRALRTIPQSPVTVDPMTDVVNFPDKSDQIADYDPVLSEVQDQQLMNQLDVDLAMNVGSTPWSATTEQTVADMLAMQRIPGTSLLDIQCGDNLCRVLMAHEDTDSQLQAAQMIPFTAPFNTDGFIRFIEDEEVPRTLIYIAREGTLLSDISP